MAVMPDFNGAGYGPLSLRGLFRERLDRDERLIAWGVVTVKPASSAEGLLGAMAPGALGALASVASSTGGSKRVGVLTDRRLLLLRTGVLGPSTEGLGVIADARLDTLKVKVLSFHFELIGPELGRRFKLSVKEPYSRDGERLVEALSALGDDRT